MDKVTKRRIKFPSEVKDLPTEEHFAILVDASFSYDDGYGEHGSRSTSTHRSLSYMVMESAEEVQAWILANDARKYGMESYRVIRVKPVNVTKQVSIELD